MMPPPDQDEQEISEKKWSVPALLSISSEMKGLAIPTKRLSNEPPLGLYNSLPVKYWNEFDEQHVSTIGTLFIAVGEGLEARALKPCGWERNGGRFDHDSTAAVPTNIGESDGQVYDLLLRAPSLPINQMGGITSITLVDKRKYRDEDYPYAHKHHFRFHKEYLVPIGSIQYPPMHVKNGAVSISAIDKLTMNHIVKYQINKMIVQFQTIETDATSNTGRDYIYPRLINKDKAFVYYRVTGISCLPHGEYRDIAKLYHDQSAKTPKPNEQITYVDHRRPDHHEFRGWGTHRYPPIFDFGYIGPLYWRIPKNADRPWKVEWWFGPPEHDYETTLYLENTTRYGSNRLNFGTTSIHGYPDGSVKPSQANPDGFSSLALTKDIKGEFDANFEHTANGGVAAADVLNTGFRVIAAFLKTVGTIMESLEPQLTLTTPTI